LNAVASANGFPWPAADYRGKRTLDIALALCGLLLATPLLLLLAVLIKVTSPGPVFYRGERAGRFGHPFGQWKLRTMRQSQEGGAFTSRNDLRITPLGHCLRLFKLDELPQLWNVLRGEMSIVGPRPEDIDIVREHYSPEQMRVLVVRPGLTCLLQVRIFPDFTAHVPPGEDPQQYYRKEILPRRLRDDLEYVDRMSLWLDLAICGRTLYCIFFKSWGVLWQRSAARTSRGLGGA